MAESGDGELDALFHALADSTRRMLLDELAKRDDQSLFEICGRLLDRHGMNLTRQAISKHLTVLEQAGLIRIHWSGRTKLHSSNVAEQLPRLIAWLNQHKQ